MKLKHLFLSFFLFGIFEVRAAVSTPAGFVSITAVPGTGSDWAYSVLSFPLIRTDQIDGQATGRITGITPNTLSNSAGGWAPGSLSSQSLPFCVRITSGAATGREFLISTVIPNTTDTITVHGTTSGDVDLTTLGIGTGASDGDMYEIVACDTLSVIFGKNGDKGVLGGSTANVSDFVQLFVNGQWIRYYLSTSGTGNWRRVDNDAISDDIPVLPGAALIYARLAATPLTLSVLGTVPNVERRTSVLNAGTTFLSSFWPVGLTLHGINIHSIPGWIASPSPTTADLVQIQVSGGWYKYYYDGSIWRRVGPNTPSNDVPIPVGTGVILLKKGSTPGVTTLTQAVPYNLD